MNALMKKAMVLSFLLGLVSFLTVNAQSAADSTISKAKAAKWFKK